MSVAQSIDAASLEKLRRDFRGDLILPGDNDYDRSRIVWNAIADRYRRSSRVAPRRRTSPRRCASRGTTTW